MITLQTNISNILARLVMIVLAVFLEYLWMHYSLKDPHYNHVILWKLKGWHLLYLLIVLFIFLIITIAFSLFGIIKVEVDTDNDTITFISVFSQVKVPTTDIDNYFDTIHRNKVKVFYGILLHLKSNKPIQLAGQNVKSIEDFRAYLVEKGIPYSGKRRMKFPFN